MKKRSVPPWRQPLRLIWFALALAAAVWLTLHMPEQNRRAPASPGAVSPAPSGVRSGPSAVTAGAAESAPAPRKTSRMRLGGAERPASAPRKLAERLSMFGGLFSMVAAASFLGCLMEMRRWNLVLARGLGYLTRKARLPLSVGLAFPTALYSNAAANSILVSGHAQGTISDSALIAGGMVNSYLAFVSHSLRVMYPVVATVGLAGLLYFMAQFSGGLLVIACVLLWNRRYVGAHPGALCDGAPIGRAGGALPWPAALRESAARVATLLFRMVCLTVPLMLGIEWLLKSGAFDFWESVVPGKVTRFFPAQLMSVVAAQMGGLVQSSLVAANLRGQGLIDGPQILLAMLVASAVGNPVRMLRRNLPSALGVFPPRVAFIVVLGMQLSRLVVTLVLITLVVAYMHYVLY